MIAVLPAFISPVSVRLAFAPLLDLKPYVPEFDGRKAEKIGWLSRVGTDAYHVKADRRFE